MIESEIQSAIFISAFKKASGSDNLTFLIIQKAYKCISKLFFLIYSKLINNGIHSNCWRMNTEAILKKLRKFDYFISKSYRIITLLNCLEKISEKIIATRLSCLRQIINMLNFNQIGGRKNRSVIDAILNLTHDIQIALTQKSIILCLFLNVKGAFNHVSINQLLRVLTKLNLLIQLRK